MRESFKRFRKRRLSLDMVIAFFASSAICKRSSTAIDEMAQRTVVKIKDDDETENGSEYTLPHAHRASASEKQFLLIGHPMEPYEIDHPIRCPHPEHGAIKDGRTLKERAATVKRTGQLPFLTESEMQKLLWNRRTSPGDGQIFPAASAPEASFLAFLS